jgi:hypothetical protein
VPSYLALVNQARVECGAAGAGALTTLQGATSQETARFKLWIAQAWTDIQRRHRDAGFMEADLSFQTTAGVQVYKASDAALALANFRDWKRDSFRCYRTSIGVADEQFIKFQDLLAFRNQYEYSSMRLTQQRPVVYTSDPHKYLHFGPIPEDVYTVVGQYYKSPVTLSADADIPAIDDYFHDLLVFAAMKKYALYESAPEVLERATEEGGRLMAALEAEYLPALISGPPLA